MRNGLVIVETRPNVGLRDAIKNHLKYLGEDWGLTVFHSDGNYFELMQGCFGMTLHTNKAFKIKSQSLTEFDYNRMLTSPMFWDMLPYDRVFIAQTDGFMRRKGIEEFYQWDYIGSAWGWHKAEKGHGGNGGESLRTVKVMKAICDRYIWTPQEGNEDCFFVNKMNQSKIGRVADKESCMNFGVEQVFSENPLCCHKIEAYLTGEQIVHLKNGKV